MEIVLIFFIRTVLNSLSIAPHASCTAATVEADPARHCCPTRRAPSLSSVAPRAAIPFGWPAVSRKKMMKNWMLNFFVVQILNLVWSNVE
jgi:hypothetical protein